MTVYRCDWCGRFYASPLPEGSACDNHIVEHNARHSADIARFNERLKRARTADAVDPSAIDPGTPSTRVKGM
jgi:hypothetical protein